MVINHRARPTRRLRRILARSRSAGSCTRDRSLRHAYERSHSCPEYPVHINTYKITDNRKDYIFQMALPHVPKPNTLVTTVFLNPEQRSLPTNIFYGPMPSLPKTSRKKVQSQPNSVHWFLDRATQSLDTNDYHTKTFKTARRRRLPNVEKLTNSRMRSLPDIPPINLNDVAKQSIQNVAVGTNSLDLTQKKEEVPSQYHGYDSEGSEAETTIHISIERQSSIEIESTKANNSFSNETVDSNLQQSKTTSEPGGSNKTKIGRKKYLSLDLKTNYDSKSPNQTSSLDVHKTKEITNITNVQNDKNIEISKITQNVRRRNSDSLVMLKSSPVTLTTPEEINNMFKRMSICSKDKLLETSNDVTEDNMEGEEKFVKKNGNTVSINEIPTFQEYRSPNSLSPQSSIDLSIKKPLPSIIKKARIRSYSLAATDHLDRELSIIANSMSVALSPTNLGSPRRVLTPVASHLPLGDTHQNIHDAPMEPSTSDNSSPCASCEPVQWTSQQNRHRRDDTRAKHHSTRKNENPPRRHSKRSNDYGGRENGRGNNQPQPLERRESRRGQFTRSLSNADVPPDEKAGNLTNIQ